ncbi:MAG: alpha-galactosidase [Hamadaea sp.]|uniref:glycoside hydrolase family 36 protein n=1 Tax=Hamadaea sp. TaxID=2024425 RepID=UPI00183EA251|nr:glycoside hydrolase family 36 protein [Hamadaea sp.]NUR70378.1 alpha-galactosidase [Hamadaea sp.]NUT20538.1 alpha-galactosidase [Hamadaea sp.]
MALLIELAGRTFALEHDGPGRPQAADGGLILPPGRVALLHGLGDAAFYRHGYNSWSPCGWRRLSEAPLRIENPVRRVTADDDPWDDPARHHSSAVAALDGGDGNVLLLGGLGLGVPRLSADQDTLAGWYERDAQPWFTAYGPEEEVFAAYARQLADGLGSRNTRAGNVWCSWYAYYENITEQQLVKDVDTLRGLPFDVVQVDDGWEVAVGDWQPNHKFPSGMKALADRIADAGLTPGLWLAPFIALPTSDLARRRPELLLRDAYGDKVIAGHNWGTGYHALDLSTDDAREYLAELTHRVVHEWGFKYLKLDFINAGAVVGSRSDGGEREAAYRSALQLIRQVAGDDAYLLGSGAILLPSLGILDGMRSGPDVAPMWQNYASDDPSDAMARNAVVNTLHRLWQQPLAEVDPDVVYFRSRLNLLTDQQLGWLRDLADICGFRAVSDPPSWLTAAELDDLTAYLAARPEIRRLGRYRFAVGGRAVDFTPVITPAAQAYPIS